MVVPMLVSIMFSNLPYLRRPALMASMQPGLGWQDEIKTMLLSMSSRPSSFLNLVYGTGFHIGHLYFGLLNHVFRSSFIFSTRT